jgi:hypothetical protein
MAEPYVRSEFKVRAVIDGIEFLDVVGITATFGLNSIPSATLQVALGTAVGTGAPATMSFAAGQITPRAKAEVFLKITTNSGQTDKMMADGEYKIFEGYYAGTGYQRSTSNATYTIHLIHWLDDLNCSSFLNGNWFQGAPHDMAQTASQFSCGNDGPIAAPVVDFVKNFVSKGTMESDLWEAVIKPIMFSVAMMPHLNVQEEGGAAADGTGGDTNKAAQSALERIPGDAPVPANMGMDLGSLDDEVVSYSANMGISHMVTNGMAYSSFWSKLIGEFGASFLFGVSPGVEFANVIPYFGGLSPSLESEITIAADEYNYANFNCALATLIESVDIFYAQQGNAGSEGGGKTPGAPVNYFNPWGRFPKHNRDFRGMIIARDPPNWLANISGQSKCAPGTTLSTTNGCSWNPQRGSSTPSDNAVVARDAERNVQTSGVLDKYAEHWFKSSVLGQRTGELSGKFRLDIAPGSTIKIEAPSDTTGTEQSIGVYALVTQVSFVINAEQHVAGTSFSLTCLRNERENGDPNLTAEKPPLYKEGWKGGPLVLPPK